MDDILTSWGILIIDKSRNKSNNNDLSIWDTNEGQLTHTTLSFQDKLDKKIPINWALKILQSLLMNIIYACT